MSQNCSADKQQEVADQLGQQVRRAVETLVHSLDRLDIEQIGHVYEGLLDHTAKRAEQTILGLKGKANNEPEATLEALETAASKGQQALMDALVEITERSVAAIQKSLAQTVEKQEERSRLMWACDNNQALFERLLPYVGLLRTDAFGNYVIVTPGSVYVTRGSDRRSTGTHYTPRSLTEPIVQHALDPLVYSGPAEGLPQAIQKRRQIAALSANEIHNIAEKARLLKEAEQALNIVKLGADMIVALALIDPRRRDNLLGTLGLDYSVLAQAYLEALNQRQTEFGWQGKIEGFAKLQTEIGELLKGREPFHWPLEFPEVFIGKGEQGGFLAIVGNPPFQGGKKITGALGTPTFRTLKNDFLDINK